MNQVIRLMVLDQPVLCFYHYRTAFCKFWRQGYLAFLLVALPLVFAGCGAWFYLSRAEKNPLFFLPFMLCTTVFLVALLSSGYLYSLLGAGRGVRESVRLSILLGVGKPLRSLLCALSWYGTLTVAVLEFPISGIYLLVIGFSVPCLLGNFYLRTVLRQYELESWE